MSEELLTRAEILAGLTARGARTQLFLIEVRTAHLKARSRRAMERFLTAEAANERDMAYYEAFSLGRTPRPVPTIQDLERYAFDWAELAPEQPQRRAALAHALGQKYTLSRSDVPRIRQVLGLDDPEVEEAFQRLYGRPLATIYAPRPGLVTRLRWAWSALSCWLESLSPFWTAFALTLTETVGAGILALPIATAGVGPLPGIALLAIFGLINLLTIAYIAESVSRSGTIRYGSGFIGRVVHDYLGSAGSVILSLGLFVICFMVLWAYYLGFSATMQDATNIPAGIWVAVLFAVGLYFVRRESLDATVASALLVGAINIGLIIVLSLLAFTRMRLGNLTFVAVPFVGGRPFDSSVLGLVFGVVMAAYFGHLSVSNCARAVIHRDPSGRSLMWGCMAAQLTAMLIYSIWVLAVSGVIDGPTLAAEPGTALIPLGGELGGVVRVLGSIFVILGMGMGSIHFSLGLYNLMRERLPDRSCPVITLPRKRGRIVLTGRRGDLADLRIALTYLGLEGERPRLRLDVQTSEGTRRIETILTDRWQIGSLKGQLPLAAQDDRLLSLEVVRTSPGSVSLQIDSDLRLSYEGEMDAVGVAPADMLVLDEAERKLVTWLMKRRAISLDELTSHLGGDAREMVGLLVDQGMLIAVEADGELRYRVALGHRRGREATPEIWQALDDPADSSMAQDLSPRISVWDRVLGRRGRALLALSPVLAVFLLAQWQLLAGGGSFSELIGFIGVVIVSLLAGVFPVLMLVSSRRKGDFVPGTVYRFFGHPLLLGFIYLISLASLFLHGLIIWESPVQRVGALVIGVIILIITFAMVRRGAFSQRVLVELRQGEQESFFSVVASGEPAVADVRLSYPAGEQRVSAAAGPVPDFASLRQAAFQFAAGRVQELKIWAHRVTPTGDSEGLPGRAIVQVEGESSQFDLQAGSPPLILPLAGEVSQVEIVLKEGQE